MILKILLVLLMECLASFASVFLKLASKNGTSLKILLKSGFLYAGGFLYVASALLNIYLLKIMPYSVVIPLGSISYVWTLFVSRLILKEQITRQKIIGILLIILGIVLLALSSL